MKKIFLFFFLITLYSGHIYANIQRESSLTSISETSDRKKLSGSWTFLEPYQYNQLANDGYRLTGMDIELTKMIASQVAIDIDYEKLEWDEQQIRLQKGSKDVASGSTYNPERETYAYFSEPYRYEENSVFMLKKSKKDLNFSNIQEFIKQVRVKNFILGVTKSFTYADEELNLFIKDKENQDLIRIYTNDLESLNALLRGEIDGFVADRVVGAAVVIHKKANSLVQEIYLNIRAPIHLMFSKKSVAPEIVVEFNKKIQELKESSDYKKIVKSYLYPVMIMQTVESKWFFYLGIIGTVSFAISAVAIAMKNDLTLFGTLFIAVIPAIGGGIIRDVIANRQEVGIFVAPSYVYSVLIVVFLGYVIMRILALLHTEADENFVDRKFLKHVLILSDAAGQSAFITMGVAVAVISRIEPIVLWGPFLAFLAASCGSIIRDMILNNGKVTCLNEEINIEVTILWGFLFSLFLDFSSYDPRPENINIAVIVTVIGSFVTKILTHYLAIPNIYFKPKR